MPPPFRHGAQGHAFLVVLREGLQAGDVHGHGKAAIAYAEGGKGVYFGDVDAVAAENGLAVDAGGSVGFAGSE